MNPLARTKDLIVEEFANGLVIYDQTTDRAHSLNLAASVVWKHCDGNTDTSDLAFMVHRDTGLPEDEDVVALALAGLHEAQLLQGVDPSPRLVSRRAIITKIGLAGGVALLLPVVRSSLAPTPAMAQSSGTANATADSSVAGQNLYCIYRVGVTVTPPGQTCPVATGAFMCFPCPSPPVCPNYTQIRIFDVNGVLLCTVQTVLTSSNCQPPLQNCNYFVFV